MECTVTSEGEEVVAAGRGVEQNPCAHDSDDLRAGSYRGRGGAEQQPGWRGLDQRTWASSRLLQRLDDPELGPSIQRGCHGGSACAAGRSATIALGDDGAVSSPRELPQGYLGAGHGTTKRPTTSAASVDRAVLALRETAHATLSHCAAFAKVGKAPQTRARAPGLHLGTVFPLFE